MSDTIEMVRKDVNGVGGRIDLLDHRVGQQETTCMRISKEVKTSVEAVKDIAQSMQLEQREFVQKIGDATDEDRRRIETLEEDLWGPSGHGYNNGIKGQAAEAQRMAKWCWVAIGAAIFLMASYVVYNLIEQKNKQMERHYEERDTLSLIEPTNEPPM